MSLSRKNDFYRHDIEIGIVPDTDSLIYALNANESIDQEYSFFRDVLVKIAVVLGFFTGLTIGYALFF